MPKSEALPKGFTQRGPASAVVYFGKVEEMQEIAAAAKSNEETISSFLRVAALERARRINGIGLNAQVNP